MYEYKVICGGSWLSNARNVRPTFRYPALSGYRDDRLGFRVCIRRRTNNA